MDSDSKTRMRRKSMHGTLLFALGIIGAIAFAVTNSVWVAGAALVFLAAGVVMLYQVGKSLS
jgi:cation transport ATPase